MSSHFYRVSLRFVPLCVAFAVPSIFPSSISAQTVEKMADFQNVISNGTYLGGSRGAYDNAIQIDNRLWFTTNTGGVNDRGTVSYYDLTSHTITAYASMDNTSGNTPQSSLTRIGDTLYFTTTRGGTGDTGTISSVTLGQSNPTITALYSFGSSATATNPRNPGGSLTAVGTDLYFTTPNGGTGGAAYGTVGRYNTLTGTASTVFNFTGTGAGNGRQPMEGFTNVGGQLYFTTFTGGANTGTGYPNGTGTLSVLNPTTGGVSTAASTPVGNTQFPSHNVTQANNGLLYFTTVGTAAAPGSIQSFDIRTGVLSTVYALAGANAAGIYPDGRFAYGSVVELNNVLYFATFSGGANNNGTVDAFDLSTNTLIKLADLDGATAGGRQLGSGTRGGFTLVNENGTNYLYLLTNAGGAYGNGTVLRVTPLPVPEPGTVALVTLAGAGGLWRWRRASGERRAALVCRPAAQGRGAFTLVELLIVIAVVGVLTAIILPVYGSTKEKGREVACLSNLRQIGTAYYSYAQDHGSYFPTAEALGNSNYRQADDPMGLPILFADYLGGTSGNAASRQQGGKVWLCPGGRPTLNTYGNNYAWSHATNVTTVPVPAIASASSVLLAWDNFTMTLPSVYNVPEPTTGGPRAASTQYRYYPHRTHTKANYLYADGHAGVL